jgi:DNA-binding transcriptional ArsR family regulator
MIHPLRMRLLEALRNGGPSTASRLAAELDESSGATSYHLRVLGDAGVIEEAPELSNGRERWWKATRRFYIPTDAETPEERALEVSARHLHLDRDEQALERFVHEGGSLPKEWREAAFTGSFSVHLTAEEVFDLGLRFLALVEELRHPEREPPPDARHVLVTLRALPWLSSDDDRP